MASPFLLVPYFGLWSAACALAVVLPSSIGDWHLVLDTAHTLLFVYLERFSDYCSEHERQLLHASYHAIFASALYYVIGAKAMTKTLAGRAYLPGAWIVVASGVFVGALNGGLDTVELQSSFLGLQQKQESMQTQLARIEAEIKDVFKHKEEEAERAKRLDEQHRRKRDAEANKKRWALAGAR